MAESKIPVFDYTSRDFASTRADLISLIPEYLPEWTNRTDTDFGMVLIELFSYMADLQSYYIDRAANEAFLATAVQRASILSFAQTLDYRPTGQAAAAVEVSFSVDAEYPLPVTVPAGTQVSTRASLDADPIIFETQATISIASGGSGSVLAIEGITIIEDEISPVGVSDGSPDQVFTLYQTGLIDGSLTIFVDEDGDGAASTQAWRFLDHLIDAQATDRAYTTFVDEAGVVSIIFGDNANGRVPPQGGVITATYRIGSGTKGNVGSGTITELVNPIVGISSVTNLLGASGGADPESSDSIRVSAPRSLSTLNRAVTLEDYARLIERVPGVAHAQALANVYTNVTAYVAPAGGGTPSETLKNLIDQYMIDKKMIATTITVANPSYVPVNVTVNPLHVLPQYNRAAVATAVDNALVGLFDLTEVGFGERISLSRIYRALQNVDGIDYAVVTVLSTSITGLADVALAPNEIPTVGTITVTATGGLIGS